MTASSSSSNNNNNNTTTAVNYDKQQEQFLNDYAIAELRFRDIEEPFTFDGLQNMLSAIRLVKNSGYKLPSAIKADLQIRVFRVLKSLQDQIKDFQNNFKDILDKQIRQNLQILDLEDQKQRKQKEQENNNNNDN